MPSTTRMNMVPAPSMAMACVGVHQEGLLITTTSFGDRSRMRNDAAIEKPSPAVPARSVPSFTEQIPTILKVVPFFHAGNR